MIYVLDTDHLSILERGGRASLALQARLGALRNGQVVTTIVTYEEQMRGWLARASGTQQAVRLVESYRRLQQHVDTFSGIPLLAFDDQAAGHLQAIYDSRVRIGTMDRRIAAIALANEATVLSRNISDFSKVPNLRVEDWSMETSR